MNSNCPRDNVSQFNLRHMDTKCHIMLHTRVIYTKLIMDVRLNMNNIYFLKNYISALKYLLLCLTVYLRLDELHLCFAHVWHTLFSSAHARYVIYQRIMGNCVRRLINPTKMADNSQVHKYLDNDRIFVLLSLYTTTVDLKLSHQDVI